MLSKQDAVVLTLMGLAQYYTKRWCMPSQKKIVELCWRIHGVKMSVRTLNRILRSLEDSATVNRIRRPLKWDVGRGRFKSTIYTFTGKCFNYLFKLARKFGNLWKFYRWPLWAHRKDQAEKAKRSKAINRMPKMAEYNPPRGVSVGGFEGVGKILERIRPINRRLKPSEAIL